MIDKQTGQTPPTAAERMDAHDRKLGIEPIRPERRSAAPDMSAAARAESGLSARPALAQHPARRSDVARPKSGKEKVAAAVAARNVQPWGQTSKDRPALKAQSEPERVASRRAPQTGQGRKTIVTGKWWDAKGPRTIELGPKGQSVLSSGFVAVFFALFVAAIAGFFIQPFVVLIGLFLLFRFGGTILGPIGAGIVDKAIAERN